MGEGDGRESRRKREKGARAAREMVRGWAQSRRERVGGGGRREWGVIWAIGLYVDEYESSDLRMSNVGVRISW